MTSDVADGGERGKLGESPFRVLCLDGGGMRGLYTASYLSMLTAGFAKKRGVPDLDVGAAFDLIVGTSTGAIIGCALALGVPIERVGELYRVHGPVIFPRMLPTGRSVAKLLTAVGLDLRKRRDALKDGEGALRQALENSFGTATIASVYKDRGRALAITAVDLSTHRPWVFKTPHLANSNHRDDEYRLVDVCLASTAAPIYRSLAVIPDPGDRGGKGVFIDGGLWANNPVLVGLIEALEMTKEGSNIELYSLGTCPLPAGHDTSGLSPYWGLAEWKFGGEAAGISIDAQEYAFDFMAMALGRHVRRGCEIVRFPREQIPAAKMGYLGLDDTSQAAATALIEQARTDANMTNSRCGKPDDREGRLVNKLFMSMPVR